MDNHLVKLEVINFEQAHVRLKFANVEFTAKDEEIFVSEEDANWLNVAFAPWLKKPPKSRRAKRDPNTYKGRRPTLESQGLHSKERVSASISSEARNHLKNCQEPSENTSQVINRIILEHKYMLAPHEETE